MKRLRLLEKKNNKSGKFNIDRPLIVTKERYMEMTTEDERYIFNRQLTKEMEKYGLLSPDNYITTYRGRTLIIKD
jgi:hypothetical protein